MNLQLNPITPNLVNFRPSEESANEPRISVTIPSQGYPPNVAASIATTKFYPSVRVDPFVFFEETELIPVTVSFYSQEPIVRKEIQIKNPAIRPSDLIVHDIDELMVGKEDEEKPTAFAYAYARRVIESAYGKAKITGNPSTVVPKPVATTDDAGGIRLLWNLGAKNVRLNFGAAQDRQSYLYYEAGQDHDVEPLDEDHLATRLAWLTSK